MSPGWYKTSSGPENDVYRGGFVAGTVSNGGYNTRTGAFQPIRDRLSATTAESIVLFTSFGSAHPAGMNAVFGDGSVRHIKHEVSLTLFTAVCVRNDGVVVSLDNL